MTIYTEKKHKARNYSLVQKRKKSSFRLKVMNLNQVHNSLINQRPNTYIISLVPGQIDQYYLSYVRKEDYAVIHVQFQKYFSGYIYKNNTYKRDNSIDGIIKKIIHYEEGQLIPSQYQFGN